MGNFQVNMTDVGDSFEAVPAGTYVGTVKNTVAKQAGEEAKNPGSWYASVSFVIVSPEEHKGRYLFTNVSLLPNALFTLKALTVATEVDVEEIDADDEEEYIDQLGELISGKTVKLVVQNKKYNGEWVNNVKRIRKLSDEDAADLSMLPD